MNLGEKIKNMISVDACFLLVYYKRVVCRFKDETGDIMEVHNDVKALVDGADVFSIIDDTLKISIQCADSDIIVDIE